MARFLVDEDLPRSLSSTLSAAGHVAQHVTEIGLAGASDDLVVAHASSLGSIFLTGDLGVASVLIHPPGTHPGIILLRGFHRGTIRSLIEAVKENLDRLNERDLRGTIVVIQPGRVRIHRPPQ